VGDRGIVRPAASLEDLGRIAEEFRAMAIDVLAINGGDGTNHVTLSGFLDVYGASPLPRVALLRGGTMNTVADSVGVPRGKPDQLLRTLLGGNGSSPPTRTVERRLMRITPAGEKPSWGFLFGTGVMHGFLSEYYSAGGSSPRLAAATLGRGVASAFVGGETIRRIARPFRGSVTFDEGGRWEEREYLAVAAGTIAHIGLGFRPFYRFDEAPGCFHVLGITASPIGFALDLDRLLQGKPMRPGKALEALTPKVLLRCTEAPLKYMVDGDLHETASEIELAMGPRVELVLPA
jgi:diacylglycerol kinase family enzyme